MAGVRHAMAAEKSASSIIIRPYRDADESQAIAVFVEQREEGIPGAPIDDALKRHLTSLPAMLTYASCVAGVGLLWTCYDGTIGSWLPLVRPTFPNTSLVQRWTEAAAPILATLVPLASALSFFLYRKALRISFAEYVTRSERQGLQEMSSDVAKSRETLFWVAEDTKQGKLVGIVGLDATLDNNPHTVELRRMGVALSHRRRGIAHKLTRTVVDHVKRLNKRPGADRNKFTTIKLSTTSFQRNAMHMYERHGYTLATIQSMELDLTSSER
ncbi:hypothetical protein BKA70DRAFT_1249614 [Coprinopsis sp. MPI-PUGE-AT-0042]|nr:hypothetical protein BKA70DRAFT_1249614 [Coprinopsis sp. MPI-PUGE-AT-0042]